MRILITNDDGVDAKQLLPLIRWFQQYGEVTTVVPRFEQSGKSHGIEYLVPIRVSTQQLADDVTVYTVESTPADCVRYAVLGIEQTFDLVVSGINRGFNAGSDMLYSGTVAAAREAALLGLRTLAISTAPDNYDNALTYLGQVWDYINEHKLLDTHGAYNINIPADPKGIRITRQGGIYFSDTFEEVSDGLYQAKGKCMFEFQNNPTLDTECMMSGYVSITPLTIDMTDHAVFQKLTE